MLKKDNTVRILVSKNQEGGGALEPPVGMQVSRKERGRLHSVESQQLLPVGMSRLMCELKQLVALKSEEQH